VFHLQQIRQELERVRDESKQKDEKIHQLENELAEMKEELEMSTEEITTVKRNISAIYHTAKKELERKDASIAELRQQLKSSASGGTSSTGLPGA